MDHLEREPHEGARSHNNRLAANHSLFAYLALHHPEHAGSIQRVLAIPAKRTSAIWSPTSPIPRSTRCSAPAGRRGQQEPQGELLKDGSFRPLPVRERKMQQFEFVGGQRSAGS